jgi:NAD(P)-dependent dehydrogenase (short-subunit alcohol dehydrogenase family)
MSGAGNKATRGPSRRTVEVVALAGRVEGKRTLVTGAGSGIGRAISVLFAREGARVGLVDVDGATGRAAAEAIVAADGDAIALAADVSDENEVAGAVQGLVDRWGGLDVIVANAAVQLFGEDDRVDRLELAVWQKTLAVNLTGIFLTCKHGIRALLASGGGSVVITGSPTGLFGLAPQFAAYSSSKAGVYGLARATANAYAQDGIRVNVVVPGFTDTPLVRSITANEEDLDAQVKRIPLRRAGTAEEIAAMVLFLASDESSYATGGAFFVDGGITAI